MSDHVDGPRSIGEPAADVTDLFAFTSPDNPARTVLALCVFPSAGEDAMFSNVIDHSIVVRRVRVAGLGHAAKFQPGDDEIRFTFRFDALKRAASGTLIQRGVCKLPDGRELCLTVNDEQGAATSEGDIRAFAGLRSDAFFLAWTAADLKKVPNLLQNDNVLCVVVEFDTSRVLDPARGSLFGVIGETVPVPQPRGRVSHTVARIDWVGRPEQTNIRLSNPGLSNAADLRDLWNQQTPFAIDKELQPLFLRRLKDSFVDWDMRDGSVDWGAAELAANANVFLDDFLLIDVAKPITDQSHLEIEKSTLRGLAYQTGGGRTLEANSIDILLTWLVNHDREFLQGGAIGATKPGMRVFPYFAQPNTALQIVAGSVELAAGADEVWSVIGAFGGEWHPLVASVESSGELRTLKLRDGKRIVERLETIDAENRSYSYANVAGVATSYYTGTLEVHPNGTGCVVTWRVQFLANGQPEIIVKDFVSTLQKAAFETLKQRFGVVQ